MASHDLLISNSFNTKKITREKNCNNKDHPNKLKKNND